jgi:hypothetical protein
VGFKAALADSRHRRSAAGETARWLGYFPMESGMCGNGLRNDGRRGTNRCEWIIFYWRTAILSIKDRIADYMEIAKIA